MDIRYIDAGKLMASGRPGDLALPMPAGGGTERVMEIAKLAGGLRGLSGREFRPNSWCCRGCVVGKTAQNGIENGVENNAGYG